MIHFQKDHKYLLCMDSDGTVMDTMTLKHLQCFGPCFIEVFGIKDHVEETIARWNEDNLYSLTRGINRFQGLDRILQFVKQFGYEFEGYDEYHNWVATSPELSAGAIGREMENNDNHACFTLALKWSKAVNDKIKTLPMSAYFEGVKDAIIKASKHADLVGVSSANPQAVYAEWNELGLAPYFKEIACQDKGNKTQIIKESLMMGYQKEDVIMFGDAIGDLKAAQANGVWFFPIIPRYEKESWAKFMGETLGIFLEGKFNEEYQKKLLDEFYSVLKHEK
ncbi:MAG: HAD hydrolase-like protein [Bacilli bacterium]|nr:HAD hydrolase-like protein [Bacilli bacterium]